VVQGPNRQRTGRLPLLLSIPVAWAEVFLGRSTSLPPNFKVAWSCAAGELRPPAPLFPIRRTIFTVDNWPPQGAVAVTRETTTILERQIRHVDDERREQCLLGSPLESANPRLAGPTRGSRLRNRSGEERTDGRTERSTVPPRGHHSTTTLLFRRSKGRSGFASTEHRRPQARVDSLREDAKRYQVPTPPLAIRVRTAGSFVLLDWLCHCGCVPADSECRQMG
jgi:hypothetical protein